jgi:hypothetical protein
MYRLTCTQKNDQQDTERQFDGSEEYDIGVSKQRVKRLFKQWIQCE